MAATEATPDSDNPLDSTACGAAALTPSSARPAVSPLQAIKTQAPEPSTAINDLMVVSFRPRFRALRDASAAAVLRGQTNVVCPMVDPASSPRSAKMSSFQR